MVCTVVLSVVQDRHGYEVWISRCRHVAASCLITIFVIFCHETDFQSPSLRSATVERAGTDVELRPEKSSRVSIRRIKLDDPNFPLPPPPSLPFLLPHSTILESIHRSLLRFSNFYSNWYLTLSLTVYIYIWGQNKFYPISLSSFVEFFRRHRRRVISIYVYIA